VETVKGYAAHEKRDVLRTLPIPFPSHAGHFAGDKAQAEKPAHRRPEEPVCCGGNYPELKASEQFTGLQGSLNASRTAFRTPGATTTRWCAFHTRVQSFPTNILAGMFGFHTRQFFEVDSPADRENVAVKF